MKHPFNPKGKKKMAAPWQRPLIRECKSSILKILREIDAADDVDLWEEANDKLANVVVVYRDALKAKATPSMFTFSNGKTLNLTAMAAAHAVAEVFPELGQDDEFPAWMARGERGA